MNSVKNTIATVLIAMVAFGTALASGPLAKNELMLTLKPLSEKSMALLSVRNIVANQAKVSIFNENSELVFAKTFKQNAVVLEKFNFSRLESGAYTLEVVSENKLAKQAFEIDELGQLSVDNVVEAQSFLPHITQNANELYVSFNNCNAEEVMVNIYDEQDNLIHQEFENSLKAFGRKYSFSNVNSGTYRLEIKAGRKAFEKEVKL